MPVPQIFKDDANRANSISLGVNWEENQDDWQIVSNEFRTVAAGTHIARSRALHPDNYRVKARDAAAAGNSFGPAFRVGAGATPDLYWVEFDVAYRIMKRVGGVVSQVAAFGGVTRSTSAYMAIEGQGTTLRAYYNEILRGTVTDTSIAAGAGGLYAGLNGARLDDFEILGDFFWTYTPNAYSMRRIAGATEVVEYVSGFRQANKLWERGRYGFRFRYDTLTDAEREAMEELHSQHWGAWKALLIRDPVKVNYTAKFFGMGDGLTTKFKLHCDWAMAATTSTNGVVDSPQPTIDYFTGVVTYAAAPAFGAILRADVTDARYRVYFAQDELDFQRVTHERWGVEVEFIEEKTMLEGVLA
jgi:hypothetical protein